MVATVPGVVASQLGDIEFSAGSLLAAVVCDSPTTRRSIEAAVLDGIVCFPYEETAVQVQLQDRPPFKITACARGAAPTTTSSSTNSSIIIPIAVVALIVLLALAVFFKRREHKRPDPTDGKSNTLCSFNMQSDGVSNPVYSEFALPATSGYEEPFGFADNSDYQVATQGSSQVYLEPIALYDDVDAAVGYLKVGVQADYDTADPPDALYDRASSSDPTYDLGSAGNAALYDMADAADASISAKSKNGPVLPGQAVYGVGNRGAQPTYEIANCDDNLYDNADTKAPVDDSKDSLEKSSFAYETSSPSYDMASGDAGPTYDTANDCGPVYDTATLSGSVYDMADQGGDLYDNLGEDSFGFQ